jgi:4-azaleucine resistance transporter AzlC
MQSTPDARPPATFTRAGVWHGMKLIAPFCVSAVPFGVAFGAAAVGGGMTPAEAILMSALAFAGSAQFAVLSLWTAVPLPVAAIVVTAFLVNARHIVMGAALYPHVKNQPQARLLALSAGMTDAGWAVTLQAMLGGRRDLGILLGTILLQWPVWVGGTAVGVLLGSSGGMDVKRWGLDVLVAGIFATSVVGLSRSRAVIGPWAAAVAGTAAALLWLPGNWYILVGGLCAGVAGLLTDRRDQERPS